MMDYDLLKKLASFKILYRERFKESLDLNSFMSNALYRDKVLAESEESGNVDLVLLGLQIKFALGVVKQSKPLPSTIDRHGTTQKAIARLLLGTRD